MSIYDQRDTPAYRRALVGGKYCTNPYILKWWTPVHDQLLANQIEKAKWMWSTEITGEIQKITPNHVIDDWREEDPLCSKYAWYNVLMYFAISRAEVLGFTARVAEPEWKICPLCNERFVEDSLPWPLVQRLGIEHLDFCAPCLKEAIFDGSDYLAKDQVLSYLRSLAKTLQKVPNQGFGEDVDDLKGLDYEERLVVLQLLKERPTVSCVKRLFGSWLTALVEAGVLEDGVRRTSRGTQCLAKDGHVCLSLGEKTIDDLLYSQGIAHEKEPHYPEGNFRGDFLVGETIVEYFGLKGDPVYDEKTKLKQRICKKYGIKLISIYPNDLVSSKKLQNKLLGEFLET